MSGWSLKDLIIGAKQAQEWAQVEWLAFHKQEVNTMEEAYLLTIEDISVSTVSDLD